MQNRINMSKLSTAVLMLAFLAGPQLAFADWGIGINVGGPGHHHDDHFYRWHDHPQWGLHIHFLPEGYHTYWVGGVKYYYYDGLYYTYVGGDYVLVAPPVGAYVEVIPQDFHPVIINGVTYYTDNGIYYIWTHHHGYQVVAAPVVYVQPAPVVAAQPVLTPVPTQDTFPVNVPDGKGGYVSVVIKKSPKGFVGPQGEFYAQFPSVAQLKVMYTK
jgi:hypothetical protein